MTAYEEALRLIAQSIAPLEAETVELPEAAGRVLASDLAARQDLPPFDNSAMDGYAVRLEDCRGAAPESPVFLSVRQVARAGAADGLSLKPGEAVRIMTGAPLPEGTEAVVMQEHTGLDGPGLVRILRAPRSAANVRRRGEDVRAGELILKAGARLRPYEVALLAAQGIVGIPVVRRPRAAILATGDELVAAEGPLGPGRIRNSNGPALRASCERWGAVARDLGIIPDEAQALRSAFAGALESFDLLLISGGVSVGDFDHTKALLEELGLRTKFWKAAIKPGKPLLFGTWRGKPVFGLPGNPVAALVCAEEFVRPALERMQGRRGAPASFHLEGSAVSPYPLHSDRLHFLFCVARPENGGYALEILRPQGSALLGMAVRANALAAAGGGPRSVAAGERLKFRWLK